MTEWAIDHGDVRIAHGDAVEQLRTMEAGSVHCIVTSPPFWALRDYQTGTWEGGDEDCEHRPRRRLSTASSGVDGGGENRNHQQEGFAKRCGHCGAKRVGDRQIGLEDTPEAWADALVGVFRECWRVLRDDGVLWIECGDTYVSSGGHAAQGASSQRAGRANVAEQNRGGYSNAVDGLKPKDLVGAPWLLAFALRADGWYLRSECIWARPNPMPESVSDRPTKAHSQVFLLTKQPRYFYDPDAIRADGYAPDSQARRLRGRFTTPEVPPGAVEHSGLDRPLVGGGANARTVWTISTEPTPFAHFATFPQALVEQCVKAGTSEAGCCAECGAPWRRVLEEREGRGDWNTRSSEMVHRKDLGLGGSDFYDGWTAPATLGWKPTCSHTLDQKPVPCRVLDPFMGSGTTALVSRRLGRHAVGVELSAEYLAIAADRLKQLSLLA